MDEFLVVGQVRLLVNLKLALAVERLAALRALKGLLCLRVALFHVILQRLLMRVDLVAEIARVALARCVNFPVMVDLRSRRERRTARTVDSRQAVVVLASVR